LDPSAKIRQVVARFAQVAPSVVPIGRKISLLNHKVHEATNRLIQEAKLWRDFRRKEEKGKNLKKSLLPILSKKGRK
jgi:hypothetical protein